MVQRHLVNVAEVVTSTSCLSYYYFWQCCVHLQLWHRRLWLY